jgi:retron-type reverse transcriptase
LFDINIYKSAYQKLTSNPGNNTEGTDKKILDGISLEWTQDVIKEMKDRNFQFKPSLRVYIPKNNTIGKLRPLGIPSPRDIIIQQAIKMILESVYEPLFLNTSHGLRPNRSTRSAIFEVKK